MSIALTVSLIFLFVISLGFCARTILCAIFLGDINFKYTLQLTLLGIVVIVTYFLLTGY